MDLTALRTEIDGAPVLAELAARGLDSEIADALNAPGTGTVAATVPTSDLLAAIEPSEAPPAASPRGGYLAALMQVRGLTLSADLLERLRDLFGPASKSRPRIEALAARPASRAEVRFGEPVAATDVSACLAPERDAAYRTEQEGLVALKEVIDSAVSGIVHATSTAERAAAVVALRAAQAALKAEHVRRGVVFGPREEPSVIDIQVRDLP